MHDGLPGGAGAALGVADNPRPRAWFRGYGLAALWLSLAFGIRWALDSAWGNHFPYLFFFVAVFVMIQSADAGPSLFTILGGFLLADWFFVTPRHSLRITDSGDQIFTAIYFGISAVMLYFSLLARRARAREKAAGEALRNQEEHFRSLIEHSNDVISIVDAGGMIVYQGPSVKQILGYSPEEMAERNLLEFTHPEDQADVKKLLERMDPAGDLGARLVFRHRHKLDTWRTMEASGRRLLPAKPSAKQYVVNLRDISAQRRLEEVHARLAAIVASSDDAIISKSLDGTILSWNLGAENLYGYTPEEAVGRSINLLAPPDGDEQMTPLLSRVAQGEHIRNFETVRRAKDGRLVDVSLTVSPIRGGQGQIVAASTIARNITERKQAERERERLMGELKTAVAEVKTLSGLLPICAHCKRIRDDQGQWNQIELYIRQRSNANFSHGVCPECSRKFYPELFPGAA